MARRHDPAEVDAAVAAALDGSADASVVGLAVRGTLARLAAAVPGRHLEVRVPPYGAVQCLPGPRHTRGTPPAVVELAPLTWLAVATGRTTWEEALARGAVRASGERADLSAHLPLG